MPGPGREPGPPAWQADVLTTALPRLSYSLYRYIALKPCTSHKTRTACFSPAHEYTSSQILHIYGVSVVICGGLLTLLTRLAAANHHKPPPKRRKYAGFGTMGIPAIRESIVLHRQGLSTLKEPNYLRLSLILAVVCSVLRWFVIACFPLFSLPIIPNSGGDLWWFAVICGGCGRLRCFVVVCGGLWSFAVVCGRLRWFVVVCLIVIPVWVDTSRLLASSTHYVQPNSHTTTTH